MSRGDLIRMRRTLIDKVTNILPNCEIFKNKAIYPQRHYDDMMAIDKGFQEQIQTIRNIDDLKSMQLQISKSKHSLLNQQIGASTHIDSEPTSAKRLNHSPTQSVPISPNLFLPDLNKINSKFGFGMTKKPALDEISDIQQMDPPIKLSGYEVKRRSESKRLKGMQSAINQGVFKNTDISRNSILSYTNDAKHEYISSSKSKQLEKLRNSEVKNVFTSPKARDQLSYFKKRNHSTIGPNVLKDQSLDASLIENSINNADQLMLFGSSTKPARILESTSPRVARLPQLRK